MATRPVAAPHREGRAMLAGCCLPYAPSTRNERLVFVLHNGGGTLHEAPLDKMDSQLGPVDGSGQGNWPM